MTALPTLTPTDWQLGRDDDYLLKSRYVASRLGAGVDVVQGAGGMTDIAHEIADVTADLRQATVDQQQRVDDAWRYLEREIGILRSLRASVAAADGICIKGVDQEIKTKEGIRQWPM